MSVSAVGLCLTVLLTCVIVDTLVEGGSLRRHRGHHSRPEYRASEEPMSLNSLPKHSEDRDDRPKHRDAYLRPGERHGYLEAQAESFSSSEYEDVEVQAPVVHRRRHVSRNYQESPRARDEGSRYEDEYEELLAPTSARKMHHSRHSGSYRRLSKDRARQLELEHEKTLNKYYEYEVREVQNSSVCNYTVVPIPDPTGSRTPKVLEHVKCNHAGSSCLGTSTHCCIQTYKRIEVSYGDGSSKIIKLYVGCVCALQVVLREPTLPIND